MDGSLSITLRYLELRFQRLSTADNIASIKGQLWKKVPVVLGQVKLTPFLSRHDPICVSVCMY